MALKKSSYSSRRLILAVSLLVIVSGAVLFTETSTSTAPSGFLALQPYTVSVVRGGTGLGTVSFAGYSKECGIDCSNTVTPYRIWGLPTSLADTTLIAKPAYNSEFIKWVECPTSEYEDWESSCEIHGSTSKITAIFDQKSGFNYQNFIKEKSGSYSTSLTITFGEELYAYQIKIWGKPGGEYCDASVKATFYAENGAKVDTITTKAVDAHKTQAAEKTYVDAPIKVKKVKATVSGGCKYIDNFKVAVRGEKVTAVTPVNYKLTVKKSGTGQGTVKTNDPSRINCGSDCTEFYDSGKSSTLTAYPSS
ncbi:MAG: hypothetical protein ABIG20_01815, partial [archaeon]